MAYEKCCRNCEHAFLETCKGCDTFGDNSYQNFELRKEFAQIEMGTLVERRNGKLADLTGQRFGKLTVVSFAGRNIHRSLMWLCKCDCGNTTTVRGEYLKGGYTSSCGCLRGKSALHNQSRTRLYRTWQNIKELCYNPNAHSYSNYGGRGVKVCNEWKDNFLSFRDWSIDNGYEELPSKGANKCMLKRIDENGDFEPSNCVWVTSKIQTTKIAYDGLTLKQIAEKHNISYGTLVGRLNHGWAIQKAIETPTRKWVQKGD